MEWKIGEIKQVNGEWYQCIEGTGCYKCDFNIDESTCIADNPHCTCRSDKKDVVFKKLEKVGEPYRRWLSPFNNIMVQRYRLYGRNVIMPDEPYMYFNAIDNTIEIEIKQNKEDMEEKDIKPYDKIFSEGTVSNTENLVTSSLKPFDLEAAKAGKPVCTRDGRKARIICWDRKDIKPIVALVTSINGDNINEKAFYYFEDGQHLSKYDNNINDLMMLPEKKEGWVNVYKGGLLDTKSYNTKKEAFDKASPEDYVDTVKINWSE